MKIVALMPMKANSERVKNKNLRLFNGNPLCFHVLTTLSNCERIDEIIVNTDGVELTAYLNEHFPEVKIHKRPLDICGDFVSMNEIIHYDIQNSDGDVFIQTHATNPLLTAQSIDRALECFVSKQGDFDSVFSVTQLQTRLYSKEGKAVNHDPQILQRTQDLDPIFEENSCFYIFTPSSFKRAQNNRLGRKPILYPINKNEAIDIDDEEDFQFAEAFYKFKNV